MFIWQSLRFNFRADFWSFEAKQWLTKMLADDTQFLLFLRRYDGFGVIEIWLLTKMSTGGAMVAEADFIFCSLLPCGLEWEGCCSFKFHHDLLAASNPGIH